MRPQQYSPEMIRKLLEETKVLEIEKIIKKIGCSSTTYFRLMDEIEHFTSYNFLKRYVTLRKTPRFNQYGLWEHEGIKFSKWGGVKATLKQIVDESPAGMTVAELTQILGIRINNQLIKLLAAKKIVRKREGKFQVYFSAEQAIQQKQNQTRKDGATQEQQLPFSKSQLLQIILALIEHSKLSCQELIALLRNKGVKVQKKAVQWVFDTFEIEKKGSP